MPQTIGKYRLDRELGRGGMGVVWEAHDTQLERRVAIKLMHGPERGSSFRPAQFEREARAVARLQHAHVVQIYDYGITEEDRPYMVMELLEGESFSQRLHRTRTMTPAALSPILTQVAKALQAAHEAGIIHRDLKPGNIFLAHQAGEMVVKILDFGIAVMQAGDSGVAAGDAPRAPLAGTPPYMSPEQVRCDSIDHRSDLWSLAVIAYEALTGRMPFAFHSTSGLLMRICMEPFVPPSTIVPALGPEFDAFFTLALAKHPNERFATARDLAAAFSALVADERAAPLKILVVDDEPDLVLLIEQCFQEQIDAGRYCFVFAGNGIEGLEALGEHPDIDIALTDLRMPGMDGLTFLGKIGAIAPALRAIVISAYSDMGNIRQAMNCGAFDFLIKPLDFMDLQSTIERAGREVRQLRRSLQSLEENETLRMFVSPAVRERLLPLLKVSDSITGENIETTVAVMRLRGPERDAGDPRDAIAMLNRTYDALMPVFDVHQGAVARFLGDSLVAWFRGDEHQHRALMACLEARDLLGMLRLRQPPFPALHIGVATGMVVAGNVGAPSKRRFEYALFGEPVQLAHALEHMAEPGQILAVGPLEGPMGERFGWEPTGERVADPAGQLRDVIDVSFVRMLDTETSPLMRTRGMGAEDTITEQPSAVQR